MSKINEQLKRVLKYIKNGIPRTYVNVLSREIDSLFIGKRILITGGNSGIGLEIARKCIRGGALKCVITGRNEQKLIERCSELDRRGGVEYCVFDVSDAVNMEKYYGKCIEKAGGAFDIVVGNAGIFYEKDFYDYDESDWNRMFDTNLKGAYYLSQQAIKSFYQNGIKGNMVFITSERGIMADTHLYGISKAGLNSFIRGLAKSCSKDGIRVNGVAPGITATGINGIEPMNDLSHENALERVLRAEEIAEVAVFLMSDGSVCINGEIIVCDGGNTIV